MTEKSFTPLKLYSADPPELGKARNWPDITALRERLLREISALDRQCERFEQVDGKMDFSLQQTCREMIHSRQALYRQLQR